MLQLEKEISPDLTLLNSKSKSLAPSLKLTQSLSLPRSFRRIDDPMESFRHQRELTGIYSEEFSRLSRNKDPPPEMSPRLEE